jgi:hypothetical protein
LSSEHQDDLASFLSPAERERLAACLSEDALRTLLDTLCEHPGVRDAVLAEVADTAEAYGDRAVVLALARVAYANESAHQRESGS